MSEMTDLEMSASPSGEIPLGGYYVIVGRGFSAVLNHVTLRASTWGQERLGDLPVLHIGFEDPWSCYRSHRMGQFPHLLALPGFGAAAADEKVEEYQESSRFAEALRIEFEGLRARHPDVYVKKGWVAALQPRDGASGEQRDQLIRVLSEAAIDSGPLLSPYPPGHPPYRLLVIDPEGAAELVYASKVDLCTGNGTPNLLPGEVMDDALYSEYKGKPWQPPEEKRAFRYVLSGFEAMYGISPSPQGERIGIHGSGGVGVNLVETGLASGKWIDWMARETHHEAFPPSGRNDILLQGGRLEDRKAGKLRPYHTRLRFGHGVEVESIRGKEVELSPFSASLQPEMTDYHGERVPLSEKRFEYSSAAQPDHPPSAPYSQLVVTRGYESSRRRPGTAPFLAWLLEELEGLQAITSHDGRMVGLESETGALRILGRAATAYPADGYQDASGSLQKTREYHRTLPLQAQVGGPEALAGIPHNAVSIGLANRYLTSSKVNSNVNSASEKELRLLLGPRHANLSNLVSEILRLRSERQSGFLALSELISALEQARGPFPDEWRKRLGKLAFGYL